MMICRSNGNQGGNCSPPFSVFPTEWEREKPSKINGFRACVPTVPTISAKNKQNIFYASFLPKNQNSLKRRKSGGNSGNSGNNVGKSRVSGLAIVGTHPGTVGTKQK
jgi:hypothetical protein